MKRLYLILFLTIYQLNFSQTAYTKAQKYVERFGLTAIQEMEKFNIPASIILAQGILESSFGESNLATEGNNHFGIKCHSDWKGDRMYKDDDTKNECFRKYTSAWWSFRDHSKFLQKSRYQHLYKLKPTDYKGWSYGLKNAGYATNPKYPTLLIQTIEKYDLHRFDLQTVASYNTFIDTYITQVFNQPTDGSVTSITEEVAGEMPERNTSNKNKIYLHQTGNLPYIIAEKDDTWDAIALEYNIKIKQLITYNDVSLDRPVIEGQYVFLKDKKNKAKAKTYTVKKGDTMYNISQKFGIKLRDLYEKNAMRIGEQPTAGQQLSLRKKVKLKK